MRTAVENEPSGKQQCQSTDSPHLRPLLYPAGSARARHPVERCGSVEDIAAVAVTLCTDENSFLTGALVAVHRGYTAV